MSLVLNTEASTVTLTKVGDGLNQVEHRDLTRSLTTPLVLRQQAKLGQPGSKGNDHVLIKISDSVANGDTGEIVTGSISCDVSIPRDAAYTAQHTEDLVCNLRSFLTLTNQEDAIGAGSLDRS